MADETEALLRAIKSEDQPAFEAALKKASPEALNQGAGVSGWTPLMLAAREGKVWAAQALLSAGADPNRSRGDMACAPLVFACARNHAECAQALIEAGARLEERDPWGKTVLGVAAASGALECVEALIKAGAHLCAADHQGMGPLALAASWGEAECARALARAGADTEQKSKSGLSARGWAFGCPQTQEAIELGLSERESDLLRAGIAPKKAGRTPRV